MLNTKHIHIYSKIKPPASQNLILPAKSMPVLQCCLPLSYSKKYPDTTLSNFASFPSPELYILIIQRNCRLYFDCSYLSWELLNLPGKASLCNCSSYRRAYFHLPRKKTTESQHNFYIFAMLLLFVFLDLPENAGKVFSRDFVCVEG